MAAPTVTSLTPNLQGIQDGCPTDLSLFREGEYHPAKEMEVEMAMHDFLESTDYLLNGTPPWMCDYYSAHDSAWDFHDLTYQRFLIDTMQENDHRIIPFGMQVDGDISAMEADIHWRYATKDWQDWIERPDAGASTPITEPWWNGPPQHTNYAELEAPSITTPTQQGYFPEGEFAARAIGRQGDWMKRLTHETGLHYLNYDKERKVFQMWGASNLLGPAKIVLHRHFFHTIRKFDRERNGTERQRKAQARAARALCEEGEECEDEVHPVITLDMYAQLWGPHGPCLLYTWNDLRNYYLRQR